MAEIKSKNILSDHGNQEQHIRMRGTSFTRLVARERLADLDGYTELDMRRQLFVKDLVEEKKHFDQTRVGPNLKFHMTQPSQVWTVPILHNIWPASHVFGL